VPSYRLTIPPCHRTKSACYRRRRRRRRNDSLSALPPAMPTTNSRDRCTPADAPRYGCQGKCNAYTSKSPRRHAAAASLVPRPSRPSTAPPPARGHHKVCSGSTSRRTARVSGVPYHDDHTTITPRQGEAGSVERSRQRSNWIAPYESFPPALFRLDLSPVVLDSPPGRTTRRAHSTHPVDTDKPVFRSRGVGLALRMHREGVDGTAAAC
jgi:hypothetical protein